MIFLILFVGVVLTILATALRAVLHAAQDFRAHRAGEICWKQEFEALPEQERRCRHELAGRIERRTCPNAFDGRHCGEYERFARLPDTAAGCTFGLNYPEDRLYYRGHTWVRPEPDGTYTVGLDDLAEHVIGKPDAVALPEIGSEIETNSEAWRIRKGKTEIAIRAPIEGAVTETGGPNQGWYLRIAPHGPADLRHLLKGNEVSAWLAKELERLQLQLSHPGAAPTLADGGILMSGLMEVMPDADWDTALAGTFLQP
jgi:hypothetical protein